MARPSEFKIEVVTEICEFIASTNEGLEAILAKNEDYPSASIFYKWLKDGNKELLELYASARARQADRLAAEILAISDDGTNDTMTVTIGKDTKEVEDKEWVNRSRLRVDSRKWLASKLAPKKYGDKLEVESTNMVIIPDLTPEQKQKFKEDFDSNH